MSDFSDFLKLVAEEKKNTPSVRVKRIEDTVRENARSDISGLFEQLASINKKVDAIEHIEVKAVVQDVVEQVADQVIEEVVEVTRQEPTMEKYVGAIKEAKPFAQPEVPKVAPEMKVVTDKLKFLEQWVAKISAAGPGSGEVNFRYLDDVARSTMNPENDNWVLEYDAATKKVQFTENIGAIRTIKFNTAGYQTPLVAGQMGWNVAEDCLDIKQTDDTTLQVGLEHYFQVHNSTGEQLNNGEVVMFAGVDEENHSNPIPLVQRYVANTTAVPLYIVGVMTNDVPNLGHGRATVFGKVRNLNTTGSTVNETWVKGDLLWAHPTMPGKLTKVRPTAPNVATSVAAVIQVSETNGVILVRPTIFPRLYFARFRDTTNQKNPVINTPRKITFNETKISSGFYLDPSNPSRVVAENNGLYKFDVRLQFTSSNSSAAKIWTWYRVDGVDGEGTATQYTIQSNGSTIVTNLPYIVSLQAGQYFEVMWASDSTNVSLYAPPATSFCPAIPSAVIALTQANL